MAIVTNIRSRGPIGVGGKLIQPGESAEVDRKASDLKNHRFVQQGWMHVEQARSSGKTETAQPEQ